MAYEYGKFSIDTPEQVSLEFNLAGIGSRFMAVFIDTLLQGMLMFAAMIAGVSVALLSQMGSTWAIAIVILVYFGIYWGYFAGFETAWKGQTPGKRLMKIRVIKGDGRSINVYDAMIRNLIRIIDFLPTVYAIGVLTMFIDKKNRRLGDLVAGTVVIHDREHVGIEANIETEVGAQSQTLTTYDVTKLEPEYLAMIERFMARRFDIEYGARLSTGDQLASMVRSKLGITKEEQGGSDEDFLQNVARALRDTASFR